MSYELHPLCTYFPRITGAEFDALRDDIKANGLRQMIVLKDGMILDGGNRYRACIEAGVAPRFVEFGDGNPVSFVLSQNMHRRHMTPGQQAAIVASLQDWAKAQPASRPSKAGGTTGLSGPAAPPDHKKAGGSGSVGLSTVADRAAASGASDSTQRQADKVAKADPSLAVQVGHGKVTLADAVSQVTGKPKRTRAKVKPAPTTVATPLEKHDETPGPVEVVKPEEAGGDKDADEAFAGFDPLAELEAAHKEIGKLHERIKALSVEDQAGELDRQISMRQGIEARLSEEMGRVALQDKDLRKFGKWFGELRKLTGAESNPAVLEAVKRLASKAA